MSDNQTLDRRTTISEGAIQGLASIVTRLEQTVYGNGKEGLTTIVARMDERIESISDCLTGWPEVMQEKIDRSIDVAFAAREKPKEKKELSNADKFADWFNNKVLPYIVTTLLVIALQALWEMARIKLNTP